MSQSFTNKELELLVAIFKSHGGIKPSWTKIQEQGFMPDGMTYSAAAQTWFKMKKKLQLDADPASDAAITAADVESPRKKRGRPKKSVVVEQPAASSSVLGKRKRGHAVQRKKKMNTSSVEVVVSGSDASSEGEKEPGSTVAEAHGAEETTAEK